jgi:PadR family transcriptional regulator PadR
MPRGRRGWHGGRRKDASPWRIYRFVQPCLLLLLHQHPSHGYDLIERLDQFGLGESIVDSSMVYRYLREMEAEELVTSDWDTEGTGPPRRVYRLTSQGEEYLARWVAGLRETKRTLESFLNTYDIHIKEDSSHRSVAQER